MWLGVRQQNFRRSCGLGAAGGETGADFHTGERPAPGATALPSRGAHARSTAPLVLVAGPRRPFDHGPRPGRPGRPLAARGSRPAPAGSSGDSGTPLPTGMLSCCPEVLGPIRGGEQALGRGGGGRNVHVELPASNQPPSTFHFRFFPDSRAGPSPRRREVRRGFGCGFALQWRRGSSAVRVRWK